MKLSTISKITCELQNVFPKKDVTASQFAQWDLNEWGFLHNNQNMKQLANKHVIYVIKGIISDWITSCSSLLWLPAHELDVPKSRFGDFGILV